MENLELIKQHPTRFQSMTSLTVEEFELLHNSFELHSDSYFHYHTLRGKRREKIVYREQSNGRLLGSEMKLFFLLTYLKNYPLQQFQATLFGITQGKVSQLIKVLYPLLEKTLKGMGLVPSNSSAQLKLELEKYQVKEANLDATERDVNRSSDDEVQKEFYSGKKNGRPLRTTC